MPVPSGLATLSQTAGSNSPPGSDAVFPLLDDYIREGYANAARLRDAAHQFLTGVAGVDTITALNAHIGAYVAGQSFILPSFGVNTGPATLNINGLGAKPITKNGIIALAAGDIRPNQYLRLEYDGTRFQITGAIYRDFLSNAVGSPVTSSDGTTRFNFTSGGATAINGTGSVSLMVGGSAHLIVNSSGTTTLAADAAGAAEATRLGQVQAMDTAVQTAAIAAATSAATTAAQNSALGGPAQSYQDVTASRSLSTTYTNSTGRPILVILGLSSASVGDFSTAVTVAGVVLPGVVAYGTGSGYQTPLCFVVPSGAAYSVTGSNASLGKWVELR